MMNTVRIIGGKHRGRKIHFPDALGLRPTPDRVKETLFNWLMYDIADAKCLDLFAGSGSLGLEALSRGAKSITLLEKQNVVFASLKKTIAEMKIETAVQLIQADALSWLTQNSPQVFDIVFIDPPFQEKLWIPVLETLKNHGWINYNSLIYIEFSENSLPNLSETPWEVIKHKKMGAVECALLKRNSL